MQLMRAIVHNPVKVAVGVLLVVLFGVISLLHMPMQLAPEVQPPTLTITTRWPGTSPREIEREIIHPQEQELKTVEGVTRISSTSYDSVGSITLEFAVGTNLAEALLKVNTRLQQVSNYPQDARQPVISSSNLNDRPVALFILGPVPPTAEQMAAFEKEHPELGPRLAKVQSAPSPGLALLRLRNLVKDHPEAKSLLPEEADLTKLRKFAEDVIESTFERVTGVADAEIRGGQMEELQVIVDPQRLAARQLSIDDVRRALQAENKDTSGGDFAEGKRRYIVRTVGQFQSPEQVADVVLARREGAPVYVHDVAEVRLGFKKAQSIVRRYGGSCISVNVFQDPSANILNVVDGLRKANAKLNDGILARRGLQLTHVYDETEYIHAAIDLVNENIVIGGVLTIIALLLFLRSAASTLVVGLAIPTSIIGTFLIMDMMGRSLNVISLAGLAFAVGMLVDNAVVVLENIYRRYQMGESPIEASVHGAAEVWGAVIASTLTTLAVFLPVLFVEEEAGQLFRDIALAISAAVGLSLIVSITVIPAATAKLLSSHRGTDANADSPKRRWFGSVREALGFLLLRPLDAFGAWFVDCIVGVNAWLQKGVVRQLGLVATLVAVSVFGSRAMLPKVEYLPTGNRNLVFGNLLAPPGYNTDELMEMGRQIEEDLRPYWDVDPDSPEAAKLDYPVIRDFFYSVRGRSGFLGLRSADSERAGELLPLIQKVGSKFPGSFVMAKQSSLFEKGMSSGRTINVEITGPDLKRLIVLGRKVLDQSEAVLPGCQAFPIPSLDLSNPEINVIPKREQAADLGVTAADLGYTVDALVDGAYATDYFINGDKIDLTIIGQQRFAERTQDLKSLPMATPSGDTVPLAAIADVTMGSGPEQINHRERSPAITIAFSPPATIPLEEAMERIQQQIVDPLEASGELEGLYQINLAGTADKLKATWTALRFNLLLASIITYLLMAALFESWLYPFVIILSVPLGAVGGFLGLWGVNLFVHQSFDVITILGFVILIGTVVNNPILIVHQALNHIREDGMPYTQATLESVRNRIRPIFMTTLTTVLGLSTLVLFPGAGSELYRGLGAVVLGGLIVSTLISLVLVPTLFILLLRAKQSLLTLIGRGPIEPTPQHAG